MRSKLDIQTDLLVADLKRFATSIKIQIRGQIMVMTRCADKRATVVPIMETSFKELVVTQSPITSTRTKGAWKGKRTAVENTSWANERVVMPSSMLKVPDRVKFLKN